MTRGKGRTGGLRTALGTAIALLVISTGLPGQSFFIRTYDEQDGLISSTVNGVAQDSLGRMWFATRSGISVYDGAGWTSYNRETGLPAQAIDRIRADARGGIWAVGNNPRLQLLHFEQNKWESHPFPAGTDIPFRITCLAVSGAAGSLRVAVGTAASGVLLFDGSRWTTLTPDLGLAGRRINGLAAYGGGFLAATSGGLSFIGRDGIENRWTSIDPLLRGEIRGLAVEKTVRGEKVWLAGSGWLGTLEGTDFRVILRSADLLFSPAFPRAELLPDLQGGLYFGNLAGVFFCGRSAERVYALGLKEGLVAEGATALFLDRERNLWVGGLRGVSRLSSRRFFNYRRDQGLLEDEVTAIQSLGETGIAFGHNAGLTILLGTRFIPIPFAPKAGLSLSESRVLDLALDKDGVLWVAASNLGLGRWTPAEGLEWIDFGPGPFPAVTSVVVDGKKRIIASAGNAIYQILGRRPVPAVRNACGGAFIRKLFVGPDDTLYAATASRGVFRGDRDLKAWVAYQGSFESDDSNVYSVCFDSPGRVLVGTFAGLFEIAGSRLVRFSEQGFEIHRPVFLILKDPSGRLWFGTDNGVVLWDGKAARFFSKSDGLAGREVNRSAGIVDRAGQVWIGTNSGASSYRKEFDLGPDVVPPPLVSLTGLDVDGRPVDISREIGLPYRQNNLVFHFLGTSFLDESAIRFQSRLDGFDRDWSGEYAAVDRQIRYTNLRPGRYVFNLRVRNALGTWSKTAVSPVIRIGNPFWLQWWFIALSILIGTGTTLSLGLALTQHRQRERLEALVRARTAQIRAALNEKEILLKEVHHRVKNNLQIISSLLFLQSRKIKDPTALGLFQASISRIRAMALVHESLYRSDRLTAIAMEDYFRQLVDNLSDTYALRKETVTIEVRAPGISLPLETAITYGLIVNELISNAFKHAFPGNRSGIIRVLLAEAAEHPDGRRIVLTVQDDGVGIPPDKEGGTADSLGLRLVQNLASQLDGTIEVRRDGGTVFRITFPG
jgi:two-component sensor histidine kinase/ligand-binding sensor domain-containing protein